MLLQQLVHSANCDDITFFGDIELDITLAKGFFWCHTLRHSRAAEYIVGAYYNPHKNLSHRNADIVRSPTHLERHEHSSSESIPEQRNKTLASSD